MKRLIKKYKYIIKSAASELLVWAKMRTYSFMTKNHNQLDVSPLSLKSLPYPVRWQEVFKHEKLILEIGSGHGELLKFLALKDRTSLVIGFEITKEFALKTNKGIKNLENALILKGDGYSSSLNNFGNRSIDKIYILFPDPWHKKRHHKRRPIEKGWFRKVNNKLKVGGTIFFATDWEEYFDFVGHQCESVKDLYSIESGLYEPNEQGVVETHYYRKWRKLDRKFQFIKLIKR